MDIGGDNKEVSKVSEPTGLWTYCMRCDELTPKNHLCYKDKKIDRLKGLRLASESYLKEHQKEVQIKKG